MPSPHPAVVYGTDLAVSYEPGRQLSAAARSTWSTAVGPFLPTVGTVVDVGAGTGRFARLIAQSTRLSVIAIEPSSEMRRTGRGVMGDQPLKWLAGAAEHLPLASASADVVWTAFTAHYLDLGPTGREFRRVLRDDGCVLVWHAFPEVFDELEWYRWFPSARAIDESRIPTLEQVVGAFDAVGLELVARSTHRMRIADDLHELADRLAHRAISTLRLIRDTDFEQGLADLRRHADSASPRPIFSPNILATFRVR